MIAIFDLDGTILSVNSFKVWTTFMLRGQFDHLSPPRRAQFAFETFGAVAARKLFRSDHDRLKWRLQRLWQKAIIGDAGRSERRLIEDLRSYVRPELTDTLTAVAQGKIDAVMATAAAGDYAYGFGRALGFTHIVATPMNRPRSQPQTCGPHKLTAVTDYLIRHDWQHRPRVLFTDHPEDLPLIRACGTVYWFGSAADRATVMREAPGVQIKDGFSEPFNIALLAA